MPDVNGILSKQCKFEPTRATPSIIQFHNLQFFREKYVTKAEFDNLKAQFDHLAALVQRSIPTAPTANIPHFSMGIQLTMTEIPSKAVSGYSLGASSSIPNVYSPLMPPPPPPSQPSCQIDTSSSTRPKETPSSSFMRHILHSPSLARHRALAGDITSSSSTIRNSPLSLASIASPYHPDPQHLHQHHQPHSQPPNPAKKMPHADAYPG